MFGISDDGKVLGLSKQHVIIKTVAGADRGCQPQLNSYVTACTVEVEGKQFVVTTLPPLEGMYSTNSIYRRRREVENVVVYSNDLKHFALRHLTKLRTLVKAADSFQPVMAGLLMLGYNPQDHVPHARVQASVFADQGGSFLNRRLIGRTLNEQLAVVITFITP